MEIRPEPINLQRDLQTIRESLLNEISLRLHADLDESDDTALLAAIDKAARRGALLGIQTAQEQFREAVAEVSRQTGRPLTVKHQVADEDVDEVDIWAERFGD